MADGVNAREHSMKAANAKAVPDCVVIEPQLKQLPSGYMPALAPSQGGDGSINGGQRAHLGIAVNSSR